MLFFGRVVTGLIDYNFVCFRQAIQEVFEVRLQAQQATHSVLNATEIQPQNSSVKKN